MGEYTAYSRRTGKTVDYSGNLNGVIEQIKNDINSKYSEFDIMTKLENIIILEKVGKCALFEDDIIYKGNGLCDGAFYRKQNREVIQIFNFSENMSIEKASEKLKNNDRISRGSAWILVKNQGKASKIPTEI